MIKANVSLLELMSNSFFHPIDSRKYLGFDPEGHSLADNLKWGENIVGYEEPMSLVVEFEDQLESSDICGDLLDSYPEDSSEDLINSLHTFFRISSRLESENLSENGE